VLVRGKILNIFLAVRGETLINIQEKRAELTEALLGNDIMENI